MNKSRRILVLLLTSLLVFGGLVTATTTFLRNPLTAHAATTLPSSYVAPYYEPGVGADLQSVTQSTGQKYYTLAFIIANGCSPVWGTGSVSTLTSDIQYIRSQGGDVIISFGGAAGQELAQACSSASTLQAQYQAIINQYSAMHLDFDIEGGEEGDSTTYTRRNTALAALQQANPGLTISFTLPADFNSGVSGSLGLINDAVSKGVNISVVNLMTMDYNQANVEMGQAAINTANLAHSQLQQVYPSKSSSQVWSMIGITPMIGDNDPDSDGSIETFTLSDASSVLSFAQTNHVGELSFWAISRDNGSCPGNTNSSDTCDGLSQSNYAFTNLWKSFTNGSPSPTPTPTSGLGSGYYYIMNKHSGLVLDDTNGSTSNGTQIQQWTEYSGNSNQEWTFVPADTGYYYIMNKHSGLVLDDTGWSTSNGTIMQQWAERSGQVNQEWSLQDAGNGYYYIMNRYSGLVLDDTNGSTSNGNLIQQWTEYSGSSNQQWTLQAA